MEIETTLLIILVIGMLAGGGVAVYKYLENETGTASVLSTGPPSTSPPTGPSPVPTSPPTSQTTSQPTGPSPVRPTSQPTGPSPPSPNTTLDLWSTIAIVVGCIIGAILIGVRIFQRGKSVPGPQDKIEAKIYFAAEKAHLTKYAVMAAKESGLYTPQKIGEKVGKARNLEKFLAKYTTERHEQLKRAGQETAMRHLEQLEAGASIIEFNGVNYRTNRSGSTIQLEPSELITSKALLWVVFFGAFGVTIALLITSDLYFKDEKGNKMPRDGFIYLFFVSFSGLVASLTTTLFRFAGSKGVLGRFAKRMHAVGEEQRGGIQEVAAKVMPAFELMRAATEKGAEAVKEEESAFILTFENRARSVDPIDALTKE